MFGQCVATDDLSVLLGEGPEFGRSIGIIDRRLCRQGNAFRFGDIRGCIQIGEPADAGDKNKPDKP